MRALVLLALVSCAFAGEWSKTYKAGNSPDVEIRCDDGALEFTAGPSGQVDVRVTTKGFEIRPGEVEVIESQSGERISVHVKVPRGINWNSGNRSVRVAVAVPPLLTLRANTGDGSIRISGAGGDLRLNSGDGSIIGTDLNGMLEARTGDGSVHVGGRFEAVRVNSGDGSIEVRAATGSVVKSGWNIETGDGSVRVLLPSSINADLDLHTGDGGLHVNLPGMTKSGSDDHNLRGRINGGGLPVKVRTGDGSVTIAAVQ
jgi:DUF4097 and DUF4098 domain-containing protein YvlB